MTINDAAKQMAAELLAEGVLYQETAAIMLIGQLNPALAFYDGNGVARIAPGVLKAFASLTPDAVWSRGGRHWRPRAATDAPGRQQS